MRLEGKRTGYTGESITTYIVAVRAGMMELHYDIATKHSWIGLHRGFFCKFFKKNLSRKGMMYIPSNHSL